MRQPDDRCWGENTHSLDPVKVAQVEASANLTDGHVTASVRTAVSIGVPEGRRARVDSHVIALVVGLVEDLQAHEEAADAAAAVALAVPSCIRAPKGVSWQQ
jgi:hypothetical protein